MWKRWRRRIHYGANGVTSWRVLAWFWAVLITLLATGALLLQIIGPPLRPSPAAAVPATSGQALLSDTVKEKADALTGGSASQGQTSENRNAPALAEAQAKMAPAQLQLGEERNSAVTVTDSAASPPRAARLQLQSVNDPTRERGERAQVAASVGEPERAQQPASDLGGSAPGEVAISPRVEPRQYNGPGLSIYYSAQSPRSSGKARELAARLGSRFRDIQMHAQTQSPEIATVRFFSADDHSMAREVAQELMDMGHMWRIENLSNQAAPGRRGRIEVWLPIR